MKKFSQYNKRERVYIFIILILFMLLVVKSVWLDPWISVTAQEMNLEYWVENTAIPREFGDGFFSNYILVSRLVKVTEKNDENGADVYICKIRRYLFGILPVQEKRLAVAKEPFEP